MKPRLLAATLAWTLLPMSVCASAAISIQYEGQWQSAVPAGLGIGPSNEVVAPSSYNQVNVYGPQGNHVLTFGEPGTAEAQFQEPKDAALSADGSIYIVDEFNHRVQKFDSEGRFVFMWGFGVATGANVLEKCFAECGPGLPGAQPGQLNGPEGISIDNSGFIYVADTQGNFRIQKYDSNGNYVSHWTSGFYYPVRVAVGPYGYVYVTDTNNDRVQKFDSDGNFVSMWGWGVNSGAAQFEICTTQADCLPGIRGGGAGQFYLPRGIGVDGAGNVYVAGNLNHRVQLFDADGNFLVTWGWGVDSGIARFENCHENCQAGIPGGAAGQMYTPDDVAINDLGEIFVSNKEASRIQRFVPTADLFVCVGFEPPMADFPVTVKKNRALPLKARIFDAEAIALTGPDLGTAPVLQVFYDSGLGGEATDVTDDALSAGLGTEGNQFVFTDEGYWQFNLKTKDYTAPGTYIVTMESGDDSEYEIEPSCVTEFVIQ